MSSRIRYPSDRIKSSSSNNSLKFILIVSLIAVIVAVIAEYKYFFSPYVADSETEEITVLEGEGTQETNADPVRSARDIQEDVEFTFFDTLTKLEKYSSSDVHEETTPPTPLKKKKESNSKPESRQSIEKKEPETQKSISDSKYTIQVGSFKGKPSAETFIAMLNKKGYQATIESAEISGKGVWYRVFLKEGFSDRKSALMLIKKIKQRDNISALLKRSNNRK